MKKHLKNISIAQVVIEFVSVVFAVLLALGLNALKETRNLNQDAEMLQKSILLECSGNLKKIDSTLIQNEWYANYLDSLVQLPKEAQIGKFTFSYHVEILTEGTWNLAQNHPAASALETQFLLDASDAYHIQDFYMDVASDMVKQVGIHLSNMSNLQDADLILSMFYKVQSINIIGEELKRKYENLLNTYTDEK